MMSATSSEDGNSLPPSPWSSAGVITCAKSHLELLAINEAFDLPNVAIPLTTLTE